MSWGSEELRDIARGAVLEAKENPVMKTLRSPCCNTGVKPVFEGDLQPVTTFVCVRCGKELEKKCKAS